MTPIEVLFEVISILDRLGMPYYLGGSYASGVHGVPRSTHDAQSHIPCRLCSTQVVCQHRGRANGARCVSKLVRSGEGLDQDLATVQDTRQDGSGRWWTATMRLSTVDAGDGRFVFPGGAASPFLSYMVRG